jgi:hypothetical protein
MRVQDMIFAIGMLITGTINTIGMFLCNSEIELHDKLNLNNMTTTNL